MYPGREILRKKCGQAQSTEDGSSSTEQSWMEMSRVWVDTPLGATRLD